MDWHLRAVPFGQLPYSAGVSVELATQPGKSEAVIRTLYAITSEYGQGFAHQVRRLLRLGRQRFDLELGVLSQIDGQCYRILHAVAPKDFGLTEGDEFDLGITPCSLTMAAAEPVAFEHMGQTHETHPAYTSFRLESYIGVPVVVDGQPYGTLNFSSPVARSRRFDAVDVDALKLMGYWIGAELSRRKRVQALHSANLELEAFGRAVSHDLRSPLTAAQGFLEAFLSDHGPGLGREAHEDLDGVRQSLLRMGSLIEGMMSLYRLSTHQPSRESVELIAMAREIAAGLEAVEPERQVEWVFPSSLPVNGDPRLLRSLLENLLGNAWKYSASRAVARIELGRDESSEQLQLFVRDDGEGFAMDHAERIFEPFARLSASALGDGLGLATARRIVQSHGGRIWAESEPGEGATFRFTLGW